MFDRNVKIAERYRIVKGCNSCNKPIWQVERRRKKYYLFGKDVWENVLHESGALFGATWFLTEQDAKDFLKSVQTDMPRSE